VLVNDVEASLMAADGPAKSEMASSIVTRREKHGGQVGRLSFVRRSLNGRPISTSTTGRPSRKTILR